MENIKIINSISEFVKDFPVLREDVAEGSVERRNDGKIRIDCNTSTAFTWLIQEAGSCRFYASDIIYDIESIKGAMAMIGENIMDGVENEAYVHYIGIRDMGVDSNHFIYNKIDREGSWRLNKEKFAEHYKSLFRVTVTEDVEEYTGRKIIKVFTEELNLR